MELEKYIKVVREEINTGYYDVQDALMNRDESLKRLKDKGWKDDETAYQQEYQKIIDTFNQEIADAQAKYEEKVQEEKEGYMKEVKEFYASDGSRIDLNFMNLIKAELPLTVEEITDAVIQNADNPTMIRLIHKYVLERNAHLPEHKRIKLENKYQAAFYKADSHGKKEEKIFDTFIGLAAYAIKYPSENYTIYWQKLDEYEEDAILELLKATLIIDDQTQERINEIEAQRIERNNEKNKGKTPDFFHGVYTFS